MGESWGPGGRQELGAQARGPGWGEEVGAQVRGWGGVRGSGQGSDCPLPGHIHLQSPLPGPALYDVVGSKSTAFVGPKAAQSF